jgi:hypothetical protein
VLACVGAQFEASRGPYEESDPCTYEACEACEACIRACGDECVALEMNPPYYMCPDGEGWSAICEE